MGDLLPATRDAQDEPPVRRLARLRAVAVRADSAGPVLALARRLRARLPGDERFGDPLSTAGGEAPAVLARRAALLRPPRESAAHELGLGALQLWQSLSESAGRGRGDRPLAILFTDLVGFSSWALESGDAAVLELLRAVGQAVEEPVERRGGRVVKRLGDGLMAVFEHPQAAVDAALEAQERVDAVEVGGYCPRMRAGVHHGRPRRLGGDYLGVDVNIGARVADAAKAGQVLVSDEACAELDAGSVEISKGRRLKASGAPKDLRVHVVERAAEG